MHVSKGELDDEDLFKGFRSAIVEAKARLAGEWIDGFELAKRVLRETVPGEVSSR